MRHVSSILIFVMSLGLLAAPSIADDAATREYQVKAAMIVNFAQFVEWPSDAFASADAPLVIGVYGSNPFGDTLERITAGKVIGGRPLTVRFYGSADDIRDCQALFIPSSYDSSLSRIMQAIGQRPVLSIGESEVFPWEGGIIRFYTDDNKIRFEVNPAAAEKARLKISSKLMKLARIFKK